MDIWQTSLPLPCPQFHMVYECPPIIFSIFKFCIKSCQLQHLFTSLLHGPINWAFWIGIGLSRYIAFRNAMNSWEFCLSEVDNWIINFIWFASIDNGIKCCGQLTKPLGLTKAFEMKVATLLLKGIQLSKRNGEKEDMQSICTNYANNVNYCGKIMIYWSDAFRVIFR